VKRGYKIAWAGALVAIVAGLAWFVLAPATGFLHGFGFDQQVGMLFLFIAFPTIAFLLISSTQLMRAWEVQAAGHRPVVWTVISWVFALGLAAILYFSFAA